MNTVCGGSSLVSFGGSLAGAVNLEPAPTAANVLAGPVRLPKRSFGRSQHTCACSNIAVRALPDGSLPTPFTCIFRIVDSYRVAPALPLAGIVFSRFPFKLASHHLDKVPAVTPSRRSSSEAFLARTRLPRAGLETHAAFL